MNRIAVVVALEEEIKPLLETLDCPPGDFGENLACCAYEKRISDSTELLIAVNRKALVPGKAPAQVARIGTVPAAHTSIEVIRNFKPSIIVSAGTAGGFESRGSKVGDLILSTSVRYHDRRIPIPGYKEVAEQALPVYSGASQLAADLNLHPGSICTGDSFALSGSDPERLQSLQADAIEMEAAAVAYICSLSNTPFLALKIISDLVDSTSKPPEEQFLENLSKASQKLCENLKRLIEKLEIYK